jgi:hypothetical protein
MTEEQEERICKLREMAKGHEDYFTPTENYVMRRRAEKATFVQIGKEIECTGSNASLIHKKVLRKMAYAQKTADGMVADDLHVRKLHDFNVAYKTKNASEIIKLLLPHINQIKELTK